MAYAALHGWIANQHYDKQCRIWFESILSQHVATRAGAGIAVLPTYLAEADPAPARAAP